VGSLAGQRFTDTSSGFRAFSKPMLDFFASMYPNEYMESVEALLLAAAEGFEVREVPVVMHQRSDGAPSQRRLRLAYHFLRVLLVLAVATPRRRHLAVTGGPG
jgi:CRISPR/Cas system-associated exonuclease Cas4 (RecB family)